MSSHSLSPIPRLPRKGRCISPHLGPHIPGTGERCICRQSLSETQRVSAIREPMGAAQDNQTHTSVQKRLLSESYFNKDPVHSEDKSSASIVPLSMTHGKEPFLNRELRQG